MDEQLRRVYEATLRRVPMIADQIGDPGHSSFPADRLTDPGWLADRVADTARRWGSGDPRVDGTLWWYSASSSLTGIPIATALLTGFAARPRLGDAVAFLRGDGSLGGLTASSALPVAEGLSVLASEMAGALTPIIDALAAAAGVRQAAMWAITTDSIANRALDAGAACGDRVRGSVFARELVDALHRAGVVMPDPRFVDVRAGAVSRRFTQRASCCLIYETPGPGKCVSCPRRPAEDRLRGLAALVM
ncbi:MULTISPECIES: (2Fe-2S)-binding protein [unclassified Rhodococcus (in: high G+C Gram-positive bacteria)]|uniref:(2Fe-2S)-binding protein n=1 Tax=unclassified Rhodococcus (in: high G+C Gram-positive bacteria) TaxID=192944 RepID=UPI00163B2558|nr:MULTISPECIES: (2Fe-2S)-binding protein [unclassified Rhodococcus (in: high G+C Gram-positive bacteria)]MBC2643438.1 (2Fe-2S)-binding protein [Rhodococcus sp. 3A]MBC2891822.1 (2Fe-2S)-binding protein [Rhodococcus sp. 4CII]